MPFTTNIIQNPLHANSECVHVGANNAKPPLQLHQPLKTQPPKAFDIEPIWYHDDVVFKSIPITLKRHQGTNAVYYIFSAFLSLPTLAHQPVGEPRHLGSRLPLQQDSDSD